MDHVTGVPSSFRDKLLTATAEAGILPGDPLGGVLRELAGLPDDVERRIDARVAPLLEEVVALRQAMERGAVAIEQAAARPLMTTRQIRNDVLPTLLAAVDTTRAVIIALLLIGAVGLGYGLHWWNTPPETCDANFKGRRICYRDNGPVLSGVLPASPGSEYPLGLRG